MITLQTPTPVTALENISVEVSMLTQERLGIEDAFRQCVFVREFGYLWGIGIGENTPPVVFIIDDESNIEVLGFTPYLCGPIVRMGVDQEHIHLVIQSPEDDELYYRISRMDLSFDNPRGEPITDNHREILYATA